MRGWLVICAGLALACVGGATGQWWLDLGALWVSAVGAIMIERDAAEDFSTLLKQREDK